MNYAQALRALKARQESTWDLGLSRVRGHLASLGHPQRSFRALHVAGTNGKGSVCAMLESILRAAGHKVGLYISPHLLDVRERICVGGAPIPRSDFAELLGAALKAEAGRRLTYFELVTSVAFQYFRKRGITVAVLETGLGGRLDATNVVSSPLACVITSIAFDHTRQLGSTLGDIAREKAGIIKKGRPVICPELAPEALRVIRARARALRAPLCVVRPSLRGRGSSWRNNYQRADLGAGRPLRIGLLGEAARRNAGLALAALATVNGALSVPEKACRDGLKSVRWPGRFQVLRRGRRTVILDGAHNVEAMAGLLKNLRSSPWAAERLLFIVGMLRDKDVSGMVRLLAARPRSEYALVSSPSPRALGAEDLADQFRAAAPAAALRVVPDVAVALKSWERGSGPRTAVVCGSLTVVGSALGAL